MDAYEFLVEVRRRGDFANLAVAEVAARVVLGVFAAQLVGGGVDDLASQLPEPLGEALRCPHRRSTQLPPAFGVVEFVQRVATVLGVSMDTARSQAVAVLSTTATAVADEHLTRVLTRLPADYAVLFGSPDPG